MIPPHLVSFLRFFGTDCGLQRKVNTTWLRMSCTFSPFCGSSADNTHISAFDWYFWCVMFLCFIRTQNRIWNSLRRLQEIRIDMLDSLNCLDEPNHNTDFYTFPSLFSLQPNFSGFYNYFALIERHAHSIFAHVRCEICLNLPLHSKNWLYLTKLWLWKRHQRIAFVVRVTLSPGRLDLWESAFSLFFFSILLVLLNHSNP